MLYAMMYMCFGPSGGRGFESHPRHLLTENSKKDEKASRKKAIITIIILNTELQK